MSDYPNTFKKHTIPIYLCLLMLPLFCLLFTPYHTYAQNTPPSVCAKVKLVIKQEVTLEREAFEAHMRINNGLAGFAIENVNISVNFSDDAGNSA